MCFISEEVGLQGAKWGAGGDSVLCMLPRQSSDDGGAVNRALSSSGATTRTNAAFWEEQHSLTCPGPRRVPSAAALFQDSDFPDPGHWGSPGVSLCLWVERPLGAAQEVMAGTGTGRGTFTQSVSMMSPT